MHMSPKFNYRKFPSALLVILEHLTLIAPDVYENPYLSKLTDPLIVGWMIRAAQSLINVVLNALSFCHW